MAATALPNIKHALALQLKMPDFCSDSCSFRFHVFEFPRLDSNQIKRVPTLKRWCVARMQASHKNGTFLK
jgi:hypothetical protein